MALLTDPFADNTLVNHAQLSTLVSAINTLAAQSTTLTVLGRSNSFACTTSTWGLASAWSDGVLYSNGDITYNGGGLLTIGSTGVYTWSSESSFAGTTSSGVSSRRVVTVWVNGAETTRLEGRHQVDVPAGYSTSVTMNAGGVPLLLTAGQTLQFAAYQDSGQSLNITPTIFAVQRVA